jgi:hypothetical protein
VHHCRLAEDRLLGERVPVLARREVHGIGGGDTLLQHTNRFQADGDPETAAGESRRVLEVTGGLAPFAYPAHGPQPQLVGGAAAEHHFDELAGGDGVKK